MKPESPLVLLWWGHELRLLGPGGRLLSGRLAPREDPAAFVIRGLAETFPSARALRLIYQPAGAKSHIVPRPPGGRRRQRKAFAAEYRELDAPETLWSAIPARPGVRETVLFLEPRSPLPAAVEALQRGGLRLEGAWTVAALLESIPCGTRPGPAFVRVALLAGQALASSIDTAGQRHFREFSGGEAREELVGEVKAALARFEEGFAVPALVVQDRDIDPEAAPFPRENLEEAAQPLKPVTLSMAALLSHAGRLRPGDSSDFLEGRWRWAPSRPRMAAGLALALIGAGAAYGWRLHLRQEAEQARLARAQAEHRRLIEEGARQAAALQANVGLRAAWNALFCDPSPYGPFLLALAEAAPPDIILQEIDCRGDQFTLRGRSDGDPRSTLSLERFRRALLAHEPPWRIVNAASPPGPDFSWTGLFTRTSPPPPTASLEAGRRLQEACVRLRSAAQSDAWVERLGPGWRLIKRTADRVGGLERYHVLMASDHAPLTAWNDILASVQRLCAEPGATVERLTLIASPDRDDFDQVEMGFTLHLRP